MNCNQKQQLISRKFFLGQISLAASGMLVLPVVGNNKVKYSPSLSYNSISPFQIRENKLIVPAATYHTPNGKVVVRSACEFEVTPAKIIKVQQEALKLSPDKPSGFYTGTMLKGTQTSSIGAFNSFIEDSLVIKDAKGSVLQKGKDYLVSAPFGLIGIGTDASVTLDTVVEANYSYWHQRIDSVIADNTGKVSYVKGVSKLVSPEPPAVPEGSVVLCNVYRPFKSGNLLPGHVFPVVASAKDAQVVTDGTGISNAIKKLETGKPVKIVTWGDSITAAGDVPPEASWPRQFLKSIKEKYPKTEIQFKNLAIGGSKTVHWLNNGKYPGLPDKDPRQCRFELVLQEKPDLVVMEFLNDFTLKETVLSETYQMIKIAFKEIGTDWLIITPSYTIPQNYDVSEMKDEKPRPLDLFLRKFAQQNGCGIADAAARWKHLYKEGIPYFSLFNNGFNHPNEKAHKLFVEEIMKCFT